ncbi:hypothetical protein G7092_28845 [Mucilaginibacter sp. HC2]|uniref:hypothetical protein n=1 Tax=Mucilaginibacter inviolabilis TaxID=2714892 RepID=UPI0014082F42|nr:hypothetical protein [Mucilaginibacter inviolabilis]NHA07842.1 hypothetical protein [Mucilaginibacter inviolabilis]
MKKGCILILSCLSLVTNMVNGQIKKSAKVSCIELSKLEYLIIIENDTDRSLFLPTNAIVQKSNDTLFVDYKFSYQHHISTVYRYKIDGSEFETHTLLDNDIKPDTIYRESEGYIPNFAVPSTLFELKPHSKYIYRIANSENQQPRKFAVSLFSQKNDAERSKQIIFGLITVPRANL